MSLAPWKKCNICKKPIALGGVYWVCNVSTCNRKRTGLSFCSVSCWDAHVPMMNHRESWAEERRAPLTPDAAEAAENRPRSVRSTAPVTQADVAPRSLAPVAPILRRKSQN